MTVRFLDGFDHYATADILKKWTTNTACTIVANGRNGSSVNFPTGNAVITKTISELSTWVVGCAYYAFLGADVALFTFLDNATAQCRLLVRADGRLAFQVVNNASTTFEDAGVTSGQVVFTAAWAYVECKVVINGTTGSAVVNVNGQQVLNLSNIDTQRSGNAYATVVQLTGTGQQRIDDLYIDDSDFRGDCRVELLMPTGIGANNGWSPSAAVDHYTLVDDNPPDGDTSYVYSATAGAKDSYVYSDLVTDSGSVVAVQVGAIARKDDSNTRTFRNLVRSGAADWQGSTIHSPNTSYLWYAEIFMLDPNTGLAWTLANVNAAEFGMKLEA